MRRERRRPPDLLEGNALTLLRDGDETFPAMLEAIDAAGRWVHLEVFTFREDVVGNRFAHALTAAARRGVRVRVLVDGLGSLTTTDGFLARMREAGVQTAVFHPVAPWKPKWGLVRRDHRKILVVDGDVGFTGGLNIDVCHASESQGGRGWRDTHVRVRGPAVAELDRVFLETWRRHAPPASRPRMLDFDRFPEPAGHQAVQVYAQKVSLPLHSPIRRAYLRAIASARRRVWITNPYFLPDARLLRALLRAARRGVDVRVLVPAVSDVRVVDLAARPLFRRLVRGGVRVLLYRRSILHAKTAVVDDRWATVGSFNLDPASFQNLELNLVVHDPAFTDALAQDFLDDCKFAVQLSGAREPWSVYARVFEWTLHGMRQWL